MLFDKAHWAVFNTPNKNVVMVLCSKCGNMAVYQNIPADDNLDMTDWDSIKALIFGDDKVIDEVWLAEKCPRCGRKMKKRNRHVVIRDALEP